MTAYTPFSIESIKDSLAHDLEKGRKASTLQSNLEQFKTYDLGEGSKAVNNVTLKMDQHRMPPNLDKGNKEGEFSHVDPRIFTAKTTSTNARNVHLNKLTEQQARLKSGEVDHDLRTNVKEFLWKLGRLNVEKGLTWDSDSGYNSFKSDGSFRQFVSMYLVSWHFVRCFHLILFQ